MRTMKRNWGLWTVGAAAAGVVLLAGVARADQQDVSTERPGSIVVFPKVLWDGTRDTIVQLSNTATYPAHVHCFYINAAPRDPSQPPGPFNLPQWTETDFDLWLTTRQPTHWVASQGRTTNPFDEWRSDGSGLDPGLVPPVPFGFRGELKCVQVDPSDPSVPMPANQLKGEATLRSFTGDVSEYNAIAFQGNSNLDGMTIGNDLQLNLTALNASGEFSACPNMLLFNHFADGATDPVFDQLSACTSKCFDLSSGTASNRSCSTGADCNIGETCVSCPVTTSLTLMPCQEDLENQVPGRVTVQFRIYDEFEVPLSASTTVDCWLDAPLSQISTNFQIGHLDTLTAFTRINPVGATLGSSGSSNGGVIGIAEEMRYGTALGTSAPAAAAFNLNVQGNRFDQNVPTGATNLEGGFVNGVTDHIVIPAE
jgi:hypothetical protein